MKKTNVGIQGSSEVDYETLLKSEALLKNREQIIIRQIRDVIDDVTVRTGKTNLTILEVGFGNGNVLRILSDIYKDATFTGLEVRAKSVEVMTELGYDCRLTKTELFNEYFVSGETFDIIYGLGVLHHMSDPYKSLESLIGLLKPGGSVVFFREHHKYDLLSHLYATIRGNWKYEKNTFKVKRRKFKELLGKHTENYSVRYDSNTLAMCFKHFNSVYCKLKLNRFPLINGITIYAKISKGVKSS